MHPISAEMEEVMKKLLLISIVCCFLVSCAHNPKDTVHDIDSTTESLNEKLDEGIAVETDYVKLFNDYIINGQYFEALKVIDRAVEDNGGDEIKSLIADLKDGYDVFDADGTFYKSIIIDYDINFEPEKRVNSNIYRGYGKPITLEYFVGAHVFKNLSLNEQDLYKKSNHTIYLLDDNDMISDVYEYIDEDFQHYRVEYDGDDIYYTNDRYQDHYKNGKLIRSEGRNLTSTFVIDYIYNDKGELTTIRCYESDDGLTTTEITRHDNGVLAKVEVFADFYLASTPRTRRHIHEYDKDGMLITKTSYFNEELSNVSTYEYDEEGRLIKYKDTTPGIKYSSELANFERVYTYNSDGYRIREDDLMNTTYYRKYEYNDDYTEVTVYTILRGADESDPRSVEDIQVFTLYY